MLLSAYATDKVWESISVEICVYKNLDVLIQNNLESIHINVDIWKCLLTCEFVMLLEKAMENGDPLSSNLFFFTKFWGVKKYGLVKINPELLYSVQRDYQSDLWQSSYSMRQFKLSGPPLLNFLPWRWCGVNDDVIFNIVMHITCCYFY